MNAVWSFSNSFVFRKNSYFGIKNKNRSITGLRYSNNKILFGTPKKERGEGLEIWYICKKKVWKRLLSAVKRNFPCWVSSCKPLITACFSPSYPISRLHEKETGNIILFEQKTLWQFFLLKLHYPLPLRSMIVRVRFTLQMENSKTFPPSLYLQLYSNCFYKENNMYIYS